ncbi:MAG: alkaline phosphatase family protein [Desulfobulbaceae bacterium]|nr:alkaline phosphatase family protein [Desulfobulbaceae bacterium]
MKFPPKHVTAWGSVALMSMLCLFSTESATGAEVDENPDFLPMYQRNFAPNHEDRTPELNVVYLPDVLTSSSANATFACSHGFAWESDTRIPLLLYGKGIKKGAVSTAQVSNEDIVPTLATILSTAIPDDSNGNILSDALKNSLPWTKKHHKNNCSSTPPPKVALVFTLDQARADYFTNPQIKEAWQFTSKELIHKGTYYPNARLSYAGSRTAVSHTVIGTGATPGIHGIVGNNIKLGDSFPLAFNDAPRHSMDMFNMTAPSYADVMDLEKDNKPIIISMSPYGRAALGMGGHGASYSTASDNDIVVHLLMDTGLPYTNDAYFHLPESLRSSNDNTIRIDQWLLNNYGIDIHTDKWTESTTVTDNSPYAVPHDNVIEGPQGIFPDGTAFSFSHDSVTTSKTPPTSIYQLWDENVAFPSNSYFGETMNTPFYQLWAVDMLLKTMESEGVGKDKIADLVFYNFKCLDKVGHRYGVNSPEIYTYMYYMDYCLKKIKNWLDKNVGRNNYVMVVTSDHGAHNAYEGRILYRTDLFDAIEGEFGENVILNDPSEGEPFDDMIYLDQEMLDNAGATQADVAHFIEDTFPGYVYKVYTKDEIFSE